MKLEIVQQKSFLDIRTGLGIWEMNWDIWNRQNASGLGNIIIEYGSIK